MLVSVCQKFHDGLLSLGATSRREVRLFIPNREDAGVIWSEAWSQTRNEKSAAVETGGISRNAGAENQLLDLIVVVA